MNNELIKQILKSRCIGLTGGIATGKSSIAAILRQLGFIVFDADVFARKAVAPGSKALEEIFKSFGEGFRQKDGSLNRASMRQAIFDDPIKRTALEDILHPKIEEIFFYEITSAGLDISEQYFFYEAALLFKENKHKNFLEIWMSFCDTKLQIERLIQRDHMEESFARKLLEGQYNYKNLSHLAEIVINTNCSEDELKEKIKKLVKERL